MTAAPRTRHQRKQDTLARMGHDVDAWIASAGPDGATPYLIPLSFLWEQSSLVISTPVFSPTARNLSATGTVRVGLGPTRDVVLIEGKAAAMSAAEISTALGDAFAEKCGFDPRVLSTPYAWFRLTPRRIQAWREADELDDRELMRDGQWLVD
jgi:hypothetical protein